MPVEKKIVVRESPKCVVSDSSGVSPRPEALQDIQDKLNAAPLADFHVAQLVELSNGFLLVVLEREVP